MLARSAPIPHRVELRGPVLRAHHRTDLHPARGISSHLRWPRDPCGRTVVDESPRRERRAVRTPEGANQCSSRPIRDARQCEERVVDGDQPLRRRDPLSTVGPLEPRRKPRLPPLPDLSGHGRRVRGWPLSRASRGHARACDLAGTSDRGARKESSRQLGIPERHYSALVRSRDITLGNVCLHPMLSGSGGQRQAPGRPWCQGATASDATIRPTMAASLAPRCQFPLVGMRTVQYQPSRPP